MEHSSVDNEQAVAAYWRQHLQKSSLAYIEWSPELTVRHWSSRAAELFGLPLEEALGKPLPELNLSADDDLESLEVYLEPLVSGHRPNSCFEQRHKTADGRLIYCEWHNSAVCNGDNRPLSILSQVSDITERKQQEDKLRSSLEDKETLLEEIHHRIKNNLAVISGLLELQIMTTDDERIALTLRDSQSRIQSMALVHEKLYRSPTLSHVRLDEYVQELAATILHTFSSRQKELQLDLDLEVVDIDIKTAIPLGLLLNELVVNSVKHAFKGMDHGTIGARLKKYEGRMELDISDDGRGLPEDFSLENTSSMGMSLVQTLLKQLDAEVEVESGPGTTFHILLPLK